ncbi:hypothetical protein NDU88_000647 [Pleurodeles waltl]|uniref:Uncharacterized protein n=1 Tax=Pleurodeles waltl TaxID=8319 RepID=A0AAV7THD3_PLEWA|nr:hypothetical protein NDU88_000647 [Pleurodeles waltl]
MIRHTLVPCYLIGEPDLCDTLVLTKGSSTSGSQSWLTGARPRISFLNYRDRDVALRNARELRYVSGADASHVRLLYSTGPGG